MAQLRLQKHCDRRTDRQRIKRKTVPLLSYRGIQAIATLLPRVFKYEYFLDSVFLRTIVEGINQMLSERIKPGQPWR
jgi:hypothetical protein